MKNGWMDWLYLYFLFLFLIKVLIKGKNVVDISLKIDGLTFVGGFFENNAMRSCSSPFPNPNRNTNNNDDCNHNCNSNNPTKPSLTCYCLLAARWRSETINATIDSTKPRLTIAVTFFFCRLFGCETCKQTNKKGTIWTSSMQCICTVVGANNYFATISSSIWRSTLTKSILTVFKKKQESKTKKLQDIL